MGNINSDQIIQLLAESLGIEQASDLVAQQAGEMGVASPFTLDQAISILEALSKKPGTVGIIARFAKGRAILMFSE